MASPRIPIPRSPWVYDDIAPPLTFKTSYIVSQVCDTIMILLLFLFIIFCEEDKFGVKPSRAPRYRTCTYHLIIVYTYLKLLFQSSRGGRYSRLAALQCKHKKSGCTGTGIRRIPVPAMVEAQPLLLF